METLPLDLRSYELDRVIMIAVSCCQSRYDSRRFFSVSGSDTTRHLLPFNQIA